MVDATVVLDLLLNGLTIGIVYVLIAAGLSIIFGVMDVINFAHGELFALGAYAALAAAMPLGPNGFWIGLVVAPLVVGVVGMGIERLTLRPLYGRNPLYHILLTFGLVLILVDLIELIWGRQARYFPTPATLGGTLDLLGYSYSKFNYFMIILGGALALGAWLLLNRTRFGLIVRAGAQDRQMVRDLGINIDRYYTLVFGFGAALAGAAGVILGGYRTVSPSMGAEVIIPAFVIVVIGGLGSFRGAVVGGLLVGIIQNFARSFAPFLEGLVVYLLMIAILLLRPQGLFGSAGDEGGDGELLTGSGGVLGSERRRSLGILAVAGLAVVPLGAEIGLYSGYAVTLMIEILIWALFALSLDFVMGYTGLVSLGHAMFYGVGAYAAVVVLLEVSQSAFVAIGAAVLLAAALAWVVGYLSIRVSGVYFAMITLAFAQFIYNLVFKLEWVGGSDGLFGAHAVYGFAGVSVAFDEIAVGVEPVLLTGSQLFYYFLLVVVVGAYLLARRLMRAPFGTVLQSIRENEERAEFVGYDVTAHKRRAFVISGGLGGLAGGLFALHNGYAAPAFLHWLRSGEVIVMTMLGGMGTLYGPMLGAGVFIGFKDVLSSYVDQWRMILGMVFVLFVIFVPRGLISLPQTVAAALGTRRGPGEGVEPDASSGHPGGDD
ncbi:MAG: ABC transporter permease [Halobacteriales archaeon]